MSVKLKKYNTQTIERTWTKCEKNVMAYGQKQYDNFNATPQLMAKLQLDWFKVFIM